ncbi:hypothetical protein FHR92_000532 [Fontibacillus solani]|uniref:YtkA-like domain-containing protein n=1 Tax=Fontibacillus solani TaxID=1572857 RepID=A0A7W3XQ27_9BACL|nr:FixH family protein [Fontibacillus solani]MBA9084078.1 hypothetical protein [Fontibacillus solani]
MKIRRWFTVSLVILLVFIVNGCGKSGNTSGHSTYNGGDTVPQPIEVHLQVNPIEAKAGETVKFEAKVTHQGDHVDDAKEVMFEFWKDGDAEDKHQKVTVDSSGDGMYVLEQAFEQAGTYHVISHVTAKDQHSMPSTEFTVK